MAFCLSEHGILLSDEDGDAMDDATAIDEATSAFTPLRRRFIRMKDSAWDTGVDVGVAVERDFPRKWAIGWD